jgi:hypothetical protein
VSFNKLAHRAQLDRFRPHVRLLGASRHECPGPVEQVAPRARGLRSIFDYMRQRRLDEFPRVSVVYPTHFLSGLIGSVR